jgi:galactosamine PTS system EIIB component
MICRNLKDTRRLIEGGVAIDNLNISNLHFINEKKEINRTVYVNDKDIDYLEAIKKSKVKVFIQDIQGHTQKRTLININ